MRTGAALNGTEWDGQFGALIGHSPESAAIGRG